MANTKQKSIVDTQKRKRKESKNTTQENLQITKRAREGTAKQPKKTINKMAISTYLSIININVKGLNCPIKRDRIAEWIKKNKFIYMLSTRNSLHM